MRLTARIIAAVVIAALSAVCWIAWALTDIERQEDL